jgi:hypothetical protein
MEVSAFQPARCIFRRFGFGGVVLTGINTQPRSLAVIENCSTKHNCLLDLFLLGAKLQRAVSAVLLSILLVGLLTLASRIQAVKASETVHIRPDGGIYPSTANITTIDAVFYVFTDNNVGSLAVYRDNIVIDGAGYTLQGAGAPGSIGIDLTGRTNVTVRNTRISSFTCGILLNFWATNNHISGNNITANVDQGIYITAWSEYNRVSGNMIRSSDCGILVNSYCDYNVFSGNHIADNGIGIEFNPSQQNSVVANNLTTNDCGVMLNCSGSNRFYHNNFVDNSQHVKVGPMCGNYWDNGYPSGGNYWSDYTHVDLCRGEEQDKTGSDGVWDQFYWIQMGTEELDRYPLTQPRGGPAGDLDGDRDVDIFDIARLAGLYGVNYPDWRYNRRWDMDLDGEIDILDVVIAAGNYGKRW